MSNQIFETNETAASFFGIPLGQVQVPPPQPQPCPGDDEFEEWKKQIGGGTGNRAKNTGSSQPFVPFEFQQRFFQSQYPDIYGESTGEPRKKGVVFYVVGMVGDQDGYLVDLSTQSPYDHIEDSDYPNGYLTLELRFDEWQKLMVGQVVPTTLNF